MELQGPLKSQNNLGKERIWKTHTSSFQLTTKLQKPGQCGAGPGKDMEVNGSETESPEISSHNHGQLVFDKGAKTI